MNERITEAELATIERWADRLEDLKASPELALIWEPPPPGMRGFRSLVAELRRLRGLIEPVEMVWRLSCPSCGITPIEPLGHMRDIVTEARAIREEQGLTT
jgi:hypothetical protein